MTTITASPTDAAARPEVDIRRTVLQSPIGRLVVEATDSAVIKIRLPGPATRRIGAGTSRPKGVLAEASAQLREYFSGRRRAFDLPLELHGTSFQCDVWQTLADIPYGSVVSYADLAAMVGRPRAFRAVGQANGANPVPVVLPCHRVVASGRRIGGFGGGLPMKRRLLALEGVELD